MSLSKAERTEIHKYVRDTVERLPPRAVKAIGIDRILGTPKASTPPNWDNSERLATTEFVQNSANVFNVMVYGATGDGTTDDTAAIMAAITAAHTSGGGVVFFPVPQRVYVVNGTLTLDDMNNVRLVGEVTWRNQYVTTDTGVTLKRLSGTGTMLHWSAVNNGTSLTGWGIENLTFDGNALASTTLYLSDLYGGVIKNLNVQGATVVNVDLVGGAVGGLGFQANLVEGLSIRARVNNEIGMRWTSASPYGGNVSLNTFKMVMIYHLHGVGLDVGDADSNYVYGLMTQTGGAATPGVGILLRGSGVANSRYARANQFFGVQPVSGVTAQGTNTGGITQPAMRNVFFLQTENSVPEPTIGTGASLVWYTDWPNWPLTYAGAPVVGTSYTASPGEHVLANAGSGNVTITLPSSPHRQTLVGVSVIDLAGGHTVTIQAPGGALIYGTGTSSVVLSNNQDNIVLEYNVTTTAWFVVSRGGVSSGGTTTQSLDQIATANPTAGNVSLNGFKATNAGLATAPTDLASLANKISDFASPGSDVDWGGHKLIDLAAAGGANEAPRFDQVVDRLAYGAGYINWNFTPHLVAGNWTPLSGVVYVSGIYIPPGVSVSNIVLDLTVVPSGGPVPTYVALAGPTGTILRQSADISTVLVATGPVALPLTAAYTTSTSDSAKGLYYIVYLQNGTWTTPAQFARGAGSNVAAKALGSGPIIYGNGVTTGRTTLPANGTGIAGGISATTGNGNAFFGGVT